MNDPKDCPKRMEHPISFLERYRKHLEQVFREDSEQFTRAVALLKAHESMCECGVMPGDGNAALRDLERSLATHRDMLVAFEGSQKGDYHAKCIREIEDALAVLRNGMEAPKEIHEWPDIIGAGPIPKKTSNLNFAEAMAAVKTGKQVIRLVGHNKNGPVAITLNTFPERHLSVADMIATDWRIVEDGK